MSVPRAGGAGVDAGFVVPARVDALDRHARQRAIDGYRQDAVHALRVVVAGAGAVGNEVVKNLVLAGVRDLRVVDFDRVEAHNLSRSLFLAESDIGRPKARCVAHGAARLDAAARVVWQAGDVRDALGLGQARGAHCLVGCVDNFEARLYLNELAMVAGTPWVDAAIDARHVGVTVFPNARAGEQPVPPACYECALPASVYRRLAQRQSCGGLRRLAAREGIVPTTAVTAGIAGALAVGEVLRVTGCDARAPAPVEAQRVFFDTLGGSANRLRLARNPDCPACADALRGVPIEGCAASARALEAVVARIAPAADAIALQAPIVWACECVHCGPDERSRALVGSRASRHTDAIARCARCGRQSVAIEIRDAFAPGELGERLGAAAPEAAWARAGDAIIEIAARRDGADRSA